MNARAAIVAVLPLLLATAGEVHAHDGTHGDQAVVPLGTAWDFNLPSLDGSRFVQASTVKGPVLINFWGKDCAPCVAELPRLEAFAAANPLWTVLLVSTDSPAVAREFATRLNLKLPVLRSGANVAALMKSAGNRHGALPFSLALRDGALCERQLGELSHTDLARWSAACGPR